MKQRLTEILEFTRARSFRQYRSDDAGPTVVVKGSEARRNAQLFAARCRAEKAIVLKDERIAFMRTRTKGVNAVYPWTFSRALRVILRRISRSVSWFNFRDDGAPIGNVCPDYSILLRGGLLALKGMDAERDRCIDAALELAARYAQAAEKIGNEEVAEMFRHVPAEPPRSFQEALQTVRFISSLLYLDRSYQCGFGRIDQYLWPFYKSDLDAGRVTREEAKELLAEFYVSLNRDSDLYYGVQQGDNGQSVMLGGCDPKTGESAVNDLTYLAIEAALETKLIDPKINLRVNRNTPADLLTLGSKLTKCALGFPQYSNDDVVIPALVAKGYDLEDARNYTVAACWEFIIPGRGLEVVNLGAVSFPYAVDAALREEIAAKSFDQSSFRTRIKTNICQQIKHVLAKRKVGFGRFPFTLSFFGQVKYGNIGIHGAGAANAADALVAVNAVAQGALGESMGLSGDAPVERLEKLVAAQDANFAEYERLQQTLRNELPKVGNDDSTADEEMTGLFRMFADVCESFSPRRRFECERPAVLRPGSGSAQFYIWLAQKGVGEGVEPVVGATSDGRCTGAPFGSSLAPSHEAHVAGVMSVFRSFSKIDFKRVMNGGPVTVEFSKTVFESPEGERKLGQLIRYFITLGGQQLQLNVLDVKELEDAMAHPERHRNLIVRVWGWSGYFCELASEFQRQIIKRHTYGG